MEDQKQIYQPGEEPNKELYTGKKKLDQVKKLKNENSLLDGLDKLVSKGNLADQYKQQGGQ